MAFGFGRIEFDGNFIDLDRPWSDFQPQRFTKKSEIDMDSGLIETLKFYSKWFINARLNLLDPQEKAQLQRLFEYAEDGSSFTLIRDRSLGTYIPFEGGINPTAAPRGLKTNDDVDGTFTRTNVADSAWYLDEGTGLVTLRDGTDVPRFPAGKFGAGIQMDGAAANLITHPSAFDNAAWAKSAGASVAANTAETLDPNGGNTADKITTTLASAGVSFDTSTAVGNEAAWGIWLKSSIGNIGAKLLIEGTGGGTANVAITITPEWQRFPFATDTSGFTTNIQFDLQIDSANDLYAWGASGFDSAEFDLGTVGALSTSAITRATEKLLFPSANVLDREKGTIFIRFKPRWAAADHDAAVLFNSGASDSVRHILIRVLATGFIQIIVNKNNSSTQHFSSSFDATSLLVQDSFSDYALTYDSTIANGFLQYVDGVLKDTSSNTAFNINEVQTNFSIGSDLVGGAPAFCAFDEVLILNGVALTASEIAGLSSLGIGLGVPRNRWTVQLNDQVWNPRWLGSNVYDIPLLLKEVLT